MNSPLILMSFSLLSSSIMAQNTVRIEINTLPEYHSAGSNIYAAGSFNGWNPQNEQYKFHREKDGRYALDLQLADGSYEYKITRGSWDNAECKKDGGSIANRTLKIPALSIVTIQVDEWQDRFPPKPKVSTAGKNVCLLDSAFLIPQLKRTRRIWIYLPEDYCDGSNKKYPVLYLQDGQNVFDEATAFSGEWGIDEFMDKTNLQKCIVVAIDHGGEKRLSEYNPYDNKRFGKGEGKAYLDFLVHTLKPYIDKQYRTKKDKKNTFVAGSSMGGLISFCAVLEYPRIFGGAGIFSPAFYTAGTALFTDIKEKGKKVRSNLYFYGGKLEGESMIPDMLKVMEGMASVSKSTMITVIRDEGKHNEPTWRKEFPLFYEWVIR